MKSSKFCRIALLVASIILFSADGVSAKEEWVEARSKNFHLVGNADAVEIKNVAVRLEQFREVFRQLFPQIKSDSKIPVNVVVFKSKQSFYNFKPLNDNGEVRDWVSGYFINGEDANYIALSTEGEKSLTYRTIFHEYVHFLVNNDLGRAKIPPWLNEGLAEFYATLQVENDRKITLGAVNYERLSAIRQNKLIPLESFFNTDSYSLRMSNEERAKVFYAQAWALMHFLKEGNDRMRAAQLDKFVDLILNETLPKKAFAEAFQVDYATMEREFGEYVKQKSFSLSTIVLKNKLSFDSEIELSNISETTANIVLGDLLAHANRLEEAAALLEESVETQPDSSFANAALGMVKLRQENYLEAKKYLERAVALGDKNYLVYFQYAYVLSREGMTEYGFVSNYSIEATLKMREALKKAIALNPNFAESYHLYALIEIVRNEDLDEAEDYINRALQIAPGNQWYQMRVAEICLRREEFSEARRIARKIYETAPDDPLRLFAKTTLNTINSYEAQLENSRRPRPAATDVTDKPLTDEELAEINKKAIREAINLELRRPKSNEKRVLGFLVNIECGSNSVSYSIKLGDRILKLSSENFDSLRLMTFDAEMSRGQIECGKLKKDLFSVITYRPFINAKIESAGEIIAIEFVPKYFEFLQN